jgi:putative flippase GtrA
MTRPNHSLLIRWLKFNAVGLLGVGLQLGALTLLTRAAGVHYLIATPLAVETAVLHNFFWHERYTWRDRTHAKAGVLRRLVRFHLTNGLLSLVGNVLLMRLLAGVLHVPVLAANVLCIVTCSLANFLMSHHLVFRPAGACSKRVLRTYEERDRPQDVASCVSRPPRESL